MSPLQSRRFRLMGPLGSRFGGLAANRLFASVRHYVTFNPGETVEDAAAALEPEPVWQPGGGQKVLTVYAEFSDPWKSVAQEIEAINTGQWHPGDKDFKSLAQYFKFANHRVRKIASLGGLLNAMIALPEGSIGRLNIITHATGYGFALAGKVIVGDVQLGRDDDPADDVTFIDATELSKLRACNSVDCGKPDMPFRPGSQKQTKGFTFQDALKRLAPGNAFIYLYGCKGGSQDTSLIQALADTFDARVWGFRQELWYFPEIDGKRIRNRNWCQYPRLSGEKVQGLQNLVPDNFAKPAVATR